MFLLDKIGLAFDALYNGFDKARTEAGILKEALLSPVVAHSTHSFGRQRVKSDTNHLNQRQRRKRFRQVPQLLNKKGRR